MENIELEERFWLPCSHMMHKTCFGTMVQSMPDSPAICPICRTSLVEETETDYLQMPFLPLLDF